MEIKKYIGTKTITESNDFLRKLWGELDKSKPNAWQYYPYRPSGEKRIYIGQNNYGSFSIDYKTKGSIEHIYFEAKNTDDINLIEKAITTAMTVQKETVYQVSLMYTMPNGMQIASQSNHSVEVSCADNVLSVSIECTAYSKLDLIHWIHQKIHLIQYILNVYTNRMHHPKSYRCSDNLSEKTNSLSLEYNYDWFDTDECPCNSEGAIILPDEFFLVVQSIVQNKFLPKTLSWIINAAQHLHNAHELIYLTRNSPQLNRTGFIDIINTLVVSSLEAISNLEVEERGRCECCGQLKYKICQRVSNLMEKHIGEYWGKDMSNRIYPNRSKFLHEGYSMTPFFRSPSVFPLLNPMSQNEMLNASSNIEYTLLDFCSHILRIMIFNHVEKIRVENNI